MITITENMYLAINAAVVVFYILMFLLGYHKGILRTIINLVGTLAAVYAAWLLAPILGDFAHLFPREWTPMQGTAMSSAVYGFCNEVLWFLILYAIMKIMIALIESIAKGVQKVPGLHMLSSVAGGIFHVAIGLVWTLIFCILLELPVVRGGNEAVNHTLLGFVRDKVQETASEYVTPFMNADAFGALFSDAKNLKQEQEESIRTWLQEHGYAIEKLNDVVGDSE